jgi:hypothetical protein
VCECKVLRKSRKNEERNAEGFGRRHCHALIRYGKVLVRGLPIREEVAGALQAVRRGN